MTAEVIPWRNEAAVSQADVADRAIGRLAEWAESAQAAYAVAERLSQSSFVPDQFRGKPIELAAAILAGSEAGLSPMAAMRSFDIISGQAAPRAITLRAIVQSQGHEIVLVESTDSICKMKGRRRGQSEWQEVRWTMDRARQLGLATKHNWKAQPAAMLVARATSEICRLVASDAILGIAYTVEEIDDGGVPGSPVEAPAEGGGVSSSGTRRMSRQRGAQSPPVDATPAPEPVDAVTVESEEIPPPEPLRPLDPPSGEVWAELAVVLSEGVDAETTMPTIQGKVRQLFDLMAQAQLPNWGVSASGQDALHAALAKRDAQHLADLKKAELVTFARAAFEAATAAWNAAEEPKETTE